VLAIAHKYECKKGNELTSGQGNDPATDATLCWHFFYFSCIEFQEVAKGDEQLEEGTVRCMSITNSH